MPIKGVSEIRRMPRVGKIRLGVKAVSERTGGEYPKAVDYFVVDGEDGITSPAAAAAFTEVYGPKPREIDVMFPVNEPGVFFPQFLKRYGSGSGLLCKGDGEQAQAVDKETGELLDVDCNPEECPAFKAEPPQCRRVGTLQFLQPRVIGLGVWQIDTTSFYSIVNLNSAIEFIAGLTGGRIAMILLKLRLRPQEVAPGGKKKIVYVLDLACDHMRLQDVLAAAQRPTVQALMPALDESKAPDDLYARQVREGTPPQVVDAEVVETDEAAWPEEIAKGFVILGWPEAKRRAVLARYAGKWDELQAYLNAEVDRMTAGGEAPTAKPEEPKPAEPAAEPKQSVSARRGRTGQVTPLRPSAAQAAEPARAVAAGAPSAAAAKRPLF